MQVSILVLMRVISIFTTSKITFSMKWNLFFLTTLFGVGLLLATTGCKKSDDKDDDEDPMEIGVQGKWWSKGENMAPLLVNLGFDSIYADFKIDQTYVVNAYTGGIPVLLSGVYVQQESTVAGIWTITLNQNVPNVITSEGIFQVENNLMTYEVVQTEPPLGSPPTPEAGFGSSSGGALGTANVQKYVRVN
jgi:hypothetical protein